MKKTWLYLQARFHEIIVYLILMPNWRNNSPLIKRCVLTLFIFSISINSVFAQNLIKSFNSKKIEMIVDDSLSLKIIKQIGFSDSLFAISYKGLNELEKNLVYKMSDQLHFILFNDLNKYQHYQRFHEIIGLQNEKNTIQEHIYFPIFLNGNYTDISYQLRFGVAQQFLQEYLNGLSLKDKLNSQNSQRIPNWLIAGFINYFAGGIQHEDFEYFQTQVKNGKYRNINFVKPEEAEIFGTAVWYLLEQEKGREFNGAFWMLIKYANSFEKSFQYHFNKKFKHWMLEELSNIKRINKDIPNNNDFKSQIPLKNCKYLKILASKTPELQSLKIFSNGFNIKHIEQNNTFDIKAIGTPSSQSFNIPHTFIDQDNNIFLVEFKNGNWRLSKNGQYFKLLGKEGQYRAFDIGSDEFAIVNQTLNYTEVKIISKTNHETLNSLNFYGIKVTGILKLNIGEYAFGFEKKDLESNKSTSSLDILKITSFSNWQKIKTIAISSPDQESSKYTDFILEKTNQMGFVENSTKYRSYNIYSFNDTQSKILSINTKGYFYGVSRNYNSPNYCEYFFDQKYFYFNLVPIGSDINSNDTFIQPEIHKKSIDTGSTKPLNTKDYKRSFVSQYNKKTQSAIPQMLIFRKESQKHSIRDFAEWNFIKNSSYYLSNQELDLPYENKIPATELYNSIATIFYNIQINQSLGRNASMVTLFSNANRRRLGLSAALFSHFKSMDWNTRLFYRLRQFNDYNENSVRNRSLRLKTELIKDHVKFSSSLSATIDRVENIQSNSSLEQLQLLNKAEYAFKIESKINLNDRNRTLVNSNTNYNINLFINSGLFRDIEANLSPIVDLGINANGQFNWKLLTLKSNINSRLSLSKRNQLWLTGGAYGWLSSSPYTDDQKRKLNTQYSTFIQQGAYIRGFLSGSRIGTSYVGGQNELQINPLQIIPSLVIESNFWKSLRWYGFVDWGMAFVTLDPGHFDNPYNTVYINHPNYILKASANRSPWLYSYGYGVSCTVLNTILRLEYANPFEYNKKLNNTLLLSLGKNF